MEKVKQHPVAAAGAAVAAAAGVGLGIMVVQGVRNAFRGDRPDTGGGRAEDDQEQEYGRDMTKREPSAEQQEAGEEGQEQEEDAGEDEGGEAGEEEDDEDDENDGAEARGDEEDDIEASARSADGAEEGDDDNDDDQDDQHAVKPEDDQDAAGDRQQGLSRVGSVLRSSASAAREGYQRGREFAAENWHSHPLVIGGIALAAGAAVAMLLPRTQLEDTLVGKAADRVNGRIRQAAGGLLGQGRGVLSRALSEAADTAAREAEREGLTPQRLGRKVKRVVSQIRHAVAETVDEA